MKHKQIKYIRFNCIAGLAVGLALSGCGNTSLPAKSVLGGGKSAVETGEPVSTEDDLPESGDLPASGEELSDNATAEPEEGAGSGQPILDILTQIQIEAGAQELTAEDLFEVYSGQEVIFGTALSGDELAKAGAVYELEVTYLEQPATVLVEIVDTTPPVIEGVEPLQATAGGSISYKKNLRLSDNAAGEIALDIDNSGVDLKTPGTYPLLFTATDAAGNQAKAETTVTVVKPKGPTEEDANELADKVIKNLINDEMSQYDIAYALWCWCRENMMYSSRAEDYANVWEGAYEGLKLKKGDCYTYCATYSFLLTRCGIENMGVFRVGGTSDHKWNLVNVGDGWYHCDASPRRTGDTYQCFMQTDAQVQVYTASYPQKPNYYVFDESLYPERATKVIYGNAPEGDSEDDPGGNSDDGSD